MSRRKATKDIDNVHLSINLREGLRAKLAREAAKNRHTLNGEIRQRLEQSLRAKSIASLDSILAKYERLLVEETTA